MVSAQGCGWQSDTSGISTGTPNGADKIVKRSQDTNPETRDETKQTASDSAPRNSMLRGDMFFIEGGAFLMGTNNGMPYEAPAHEIKLEPFWMDADEVMVAEFARFVAATGYQT
ncbi:MAG: SUMF1/EgtB/PvdO family nonheme iron enzyme [Pyrinomonadaceae bacterium]|nr:SUMF1/EgtB/PvdO family nonheme iron enzyme [Pyrinomonadaceae bacterium]